MHMAAQAQMANIYNSVALGGVEQRAGPVHLEEEVVVALAAV